MTYFTYCTLLYCNSTRHWCKHFTPSTLYIYYPVVHIQMFFLAFHSGLIKLHIDLSFHILNTSSNPSSIRANTDCLPRSAAQPRVGSGGGDSHTKHQTATILWKNGLKTPLDHIQIDRFAHKLLMRNNGYVFSHFSAVNGTNFSLLYTLYWHSSSQITSCNCKSKTIYT